MKKLILLLAVVMLLSGCLESPNTPFQKDFAGMKLEFRANLDDAASTTVYPNEAALRDLILNDNVKEIGVAYIENETENSFYLAASYELAYKLTIINRYYFNKTKNIDSMNLNSTSEAFDKASEYRPIILLLGPQQTNITSVEVYPSGYVIMAKGKTFSEDNRTWNDLDLSVDKILLVLMEETRSI